MAGGGQTVEVFRPRFLSLSAREAFARLGPLSPSRFTLGRFRAAVERVLREQNLRPDALYGLFLYLAEKYSHPWFTRLDLSQLDMGKGKRLIVQRGMLDRKYQITVPRQERESTE